jgi:hypothetical protein
MMKIDFSFFIFINIFSFYKCLSKIEIINKKFNQVLVGLLIFINKLVWLNVDIMTI